MRYGKIRSVKLPSFCYQKAFWILLPIIIISSGSSIMAINAQISAIDERIRAAEINIANSDVPALKIQINDRFDRIDKHLDSIREGQEYLKSQNELHLRLLCILHNEICP